MARKVKTPSKLQTAFYHPKYWGIWFGVGILRLLSLLPYRYKFKVGSALGKLMYLLAFKRRKIALENIKIAFPEKTVVEQKALLKAHFASLGMSFAEMAIIWHGDHKRNHKNAFERSIIRYQGEQNLLDTIEQGKGVLILAPHFTTLEVTGLFVSFLTNYHAVYRPHDNPFMDYLIAQGRSIEFDNGDKVEPVSNANTRLMLKVLKKGGAMTFLPDQKYRSKGSIMVPLFGKECPSNPATSKIAKLTGCAVVPTFTRRIEDDSGIHYEVTFLPALENFPSGDDYQDTLRLHHLYEDAIRQAPEQYLWVHNRWDLKL
ncbi:lysophospholipid acyltransferase family protein [Thiomicrorhabdus sp. 6S3-12]|uniref:lysophospholipid acyltransferase family protein n=1 Tax=Thiomicrorhabdus sp. 6S3-12 TaxID=2819681 RepID=UPI001AADBD19|nr:lysophospholipid acyltransferase family protein [Thiomicrorhabdus sp. 6S3-12]MBO1923742.1 lysophospholipid acyltransferase family protein [Thiomicrorhabdus sp. 6S3-12]